MQLKVRKLLQLDLRIIIQNTAAALEPEVMPIISGLAKGFLSIVWNVFPAMPNAIPTSNPESILGNRNVPMAKEAPCICSPERTRTTISRGYLVFPSNNITVEKNIVKATSKIVRVIQRDLLRL